MRTSVVLAIVTALLAGYILFVDRGKLGSRELEQRKGTALPELVRARLGKLEIQRKGVTTVLERELGGEDEEATWRVTAPYTADADQEAVDTLLGELEWLDGKKSLGPVTGSDRARFGFDKPRVRVFFTVGDKRVPVLIGGESTRGDGVYVQVGEPGEALIAGKDLIEALSHEPGHFHGKSLHDGMLVSTTTALELRDDQGTRGAGKRADELWGLLPGKKQLASSETVQQWIDGLDGLRATRFVAEESADGARYGLAAPRFVLHVDKTTLATDDAPAPKDGAKPAAKPLRKATTFELQVGAACAGHAGESYIRVTGAKKVLCASDADLEKLRKPLEELRESRLLPFTEAELEAMRVEQGTRVLALTSKDGRWQYQLLQAGKPVTAGEARDGSVADWLRALAASKAARYDVDALAALSGADAITLHATRTGNDTPFVVRALGGAADLIARRGDEPAAVAFASSALELLAIEVARFRPLSVVALDESAVRSVVVRRGGVIERLTRADATSAFQIVEPEPAKADPLLAAELVRLLAKLDAERWVSDRPRPEHGLSPAFASVEIERAPGAAGGSAQRESITLGAETTGGRFAQRVGDPAVFVVGSQLAELAAAPLIDRTALSTPLERLAAVSVTIGAARTRIERKGDAFVALEPTGLSADAAASLAAGIATLRATRAVGYGGDDKALGLARPFATIEIRATQPDTRHTIALGADAGEGTRYARRSDQRATFVLSKDAVDKLVAKPAPH